jgi:hypothetical protein
MILKAREEAEHARPSNNWPSAMNETHASSPAAEFSAAQAVAAGTDFAELQGQCRRAVLERIPPADGACRIWHWRDGRRAA